MNDWNWDLDELVGKVMADLRGKSYNQTRSDSSAAKVADALSRDFNAIRSSSEKSERVAPKASEQNSGFVVSERVLVADVVRKLAQSATSRIWRARANVVVTPSAKDELKKLGVELIPDASVGEANEGARAGSNVGASVAPSGSRVTFSASNVGMSTERSFSYEKKMYFSSSPSVPAVATAVPKALVATHLPEAERFPSFVSDYLKRNADVDELRLSCLKETTKYIADALGKDKSLKVVLATHDAAIGSIWANRLSGVRAVVCFTFEQAKRDLTATNANVVIVDPRDVGPYPFRQIVDCFLRLDLKN